MNLSTKRPVGLKNLLRYAAYTIYGFFVAMGILATILMVLYFLEWQKKSEVTFQIPPDVQLLAAVGILILLLLVARDVTKNYLLSWCLCALLSAGVCTVMGIWAFRQYGFAIDPLGEWGEIWKLCGVEGCALLLLLPAAAVNMLGFTAGACENTLGRVRLPEIGSVVLWSMIGSLLAAPFLAVIMLFFGFVMSPFLCLIVALVLHLVKSGFHEPGAGELFYFSYLAAIWIYMLTKGWEGFE